VRVDDLLDLPLRLDRNHPATGRILAAVERLPQAVPRQAQLSHAPTAPEVSTVLADIDDAVGELFDLTPSERDLVSDFWMSRSTSATQPAGISSTQEAELTRYLDVFDMAWQPALGDDAEFDRHVWRDTQAQVIAAVFQTRSPGEPASQQPEDQDAWSAVLERYDPTYPQTPSGTLLSYGMLRAVTDSAIVIVKRNEGRLWSATAAREDAEATIAQAMRLQQV
jgi:hypothetical protein